MPVYNYTTLDDPLAVKFDTNANGINSAGQVVGGYRDSSGRIHGFLYSGRAYVTIDDPLASTVTEARGINDTGLIVGYYRNTVTPADHGFIYNPSTGTYSTIDKLGASSLQATRSTMTAVVAGGGGRVSRDVRRQRPMSCEPRRALRGSGAIKASGSRPVIFSFPSTVGSPRDSTRAI